MISARKDIIIIPTEDTNTEKFLEAFTIIKIIIIIIIIIIINTESYFKTLLQLNGRQLISVTAFVYS